MKTNRLFLPYFIYLLAVGLVPIHRTGAAEAPMNLEAVRTETLANSRALARYALSARNSELDERSRIYSNLPSLSLGASASISLWGQQAIPEMEPGVTGDSITDSFSTGLNFGISQRIYDGGKNGILKSINGISSAILRQEALGEYFSALDSADAAYFGTLEASAAYDGAEAALRTAAAALDLAESRRSMGMISYGDYLEALANKESRETALNQARRDLSLWKLRITNLTGVANPDLFGIDFAEYEDLIQRLAYCDDAEIDSLYRALATATERQNPALAKAGLLSQQAVYNLSLAKRDYFPTLNASFSTGLSYSPPSGTSLSGGRLSLSGSIPLDFWVTGNTVAKRELALEEASLSYRNTESSLVIDLQSALLDALAQAGTVLSTRRAYESASRRLEYAQELFNLSQYSVSSLLDAASGASSSYTQLIRAQYGLLSSLSRLRSLGAFSSDSELIDLLLNN